MKASAAAMRSTLSRGPDQLAGMGIAFLLSTALHRAVSQAEPFMPATTNQPVPAKPSVSRSIGCAGAIGPHLGAMLDIVVLGHAGDLARIVDARFLGLARNVTCQIAAAARRLTRTWLGIVDQ